MALRFIAVLALALRRLQEPESLFVLICRRCEE
jgi:hypothetical protein